jgi:uncharacterized protein YebE (UPF0316 family)
MLPLFILAAETCVVTISTLRMIFLGRGMKYVAAVLGFFEVSLWLLAIGEVMKNLSDPLCSLAFACGFTVGNFLGVLIEQKLALGTVLVRAITTRGGAELVERVRAADFGVTCIDAQGANGPVQIVLTIVPRKELESVLTLVKEFDPRVFYTVDGLQSAGSGVFPLSRRRPLLPTALRLPLPARVRG